MIERKVLFDDFLTSNICTHTKCTPFSVCFVQKALQLEKDKRFRVDSEIIRGREREGGGRKGRSINRQGRVKEGKAPEVPDYLKITKADKSIILSICNCKSTITELILRISNRFTVVHMRTHTRQTLLFFFTK